jgi:uncharacterized protein (UPF0332 family)
MNEAVGDLLEKSAQSISAAQAQVREGYAGFAASRAYYAMFYAVEALLLSRDRHTLSIRPSSPPSARNS